jgi:hypothetical protein
VIVGVMWRQIAECGVEGSNPVLDTSREAGEIWEVPSDLQHQASKPSNTICHPWHVGCSVQVQLLLWIAGEGKLSAFALP